MLDRKNIKITRFNSLFTIKKLVDERVSSIDKNSPLTAQTIAVIHAITKHLLGGTKHVTLEDIATHLKSKTTNELILEIVENKNGSMKKHIDAFLQEPRSIQEIILERAKAYASPLSVEEQLKELLKELV